MQCKINASDVKFPKIEVKLLADVGLVGLPSVGKSTIISCVSKSKPKIAAYHFTTLNPNLGVVKATDGRSFVMADLPGLIEGASEGEGLGDKFLRHIERTRVICHVLDMSGSEMRDPYEDFVLINKELEKKKKKLVKKPMIVVANKMDIEGAEREALKGCESTIKTFFPKLAICIYHLPDDLWEIPYWLMTKFPEYEYYIRHYRDNATETLLYAVPSKGRDCFER